jgi:hypothetical protein
MTISKWERATTERRAVMQPTNGRKVRTPNGARASGRAAGYCYRCRAEHLYGAPCQGATHGPE